MLRASVPLYFKDNKLKKKHFSFLLIRFKLKVIFSYGSIYNVFI